MGIASYRNDTNKRGRTVDAIFAAVANQRRNVNAVLEPDLANVRTAAGLPDAFDFAKVTAAQVKATLPDADDALAAEIVTALKALETIRALVRAKDQNGELPANVTE